MLDPVSWPKEGTISLMTDVMGLRAAKLVVRSLPPGRWPRELKDHDWLLEWLWAWWRLEGKVLEWGPCEGAPPSRLGSSSIPISWPLPFMALSRLDFIATWGGGGGGEGGRAESKAHGLWHT